MKLIVTFYAASPDGIPDGWPKSTTAVADNYIAQAGETVMTDQELTDYRAPRQAAYDAWKASQATNQANTIAAANDVAIRAAAKAQMVDIAGNPVCLRAIVLALIDEINLLRTELNKAKANITTWRAEAALPMRTLSQAKTAVMNNIDNKLAD